MTASTKRYLSNSFFGRQIELIDQSGQEGLRRSLVLALVLIVLSIVVLNLRMPEAGFSLSAGALIFLSSYMVLSRGTERKVRLVPADQNGGASDRLGNLSLLYSVGFAAALIAILAKAISVFLVW